MIRIVELNITDLAFDGKAVARTDGGKVVFLNAGLPGETVRARITKSKRNFDEAVVMDILTKSDDRIPPRCRHFDDCGGCSWQDLKYAKQLEIKTIHATECIKRIGGLENVHVSPILPAPDIFNYRNKMEFSFNVHPESGFTLGLHKRNSYADIFDLNECHLPSPDFGEIVRWFREYVKSKQVPVYDVQHHTGYWRFLVIRETKNTDELMINIVTNFGEIESAETLAAELTGKFPRITTIVHNQNGQRSNIATGEIETIIIGPGFITEQLCSKKFRIKANSFFQTNSRQAENLYQTSFEMLQPNESDRVLDLYCGAGTISICLADRVAAVSGVELVADAVIAAKENAEINDCKNVSFEQSDVKDFMNEMMDQSQRCDILVTDPPRSGMHPKVLKRIIEMSPEKLLYISCNPATFARDAKELTAGGYALPLVRPVDMFPHTRHIELASVFYKK
jgi:23S rRNA (uracil1939-C5)-methyltransferase